MRALSETERQRAQWLSEDLYSVSEPAAATTQQENNPQAQRELIEAIEAQSNEKWDRALELLRQGKEHVAQALLSYLRGSIWLEAGNPDVATVFYRHASQSDPENADFRAVYMHAPGKV